MHTINVDNILQSDNIVISSGPLHETDDAQYDIQKRFCSQFGIDMNGVCT